MERRALGKGLDALIPQKTAVVEEKELNYIPVSKIKPSLYQPRLKMDNKELEELKASIKEQGLIQPILVRKAGEEYEVVAGHRRFHASKSLGMKELPAIVKDLTDQETFLYALVENIQRKDLNPIEEAQAYKRFYEEFGLTYEAIAGMVGKDKTSVSNTLRLLRLPPEIQDALKQDLITRTQARTILGLDGHKQQKELFYKILKDGLTVREIEEKVRKVSVRKKKKCPFTAETEEKIKKSLGTKVRIFNKKNNSGKIVIEYYNLNDLERLTRKLTV